MAGRIGFIIITQSDEHIYYEIVKIQPLFILFVHENTVFYLFFLFLRSVVLRRFAGSAIN